MKIAIVQPLGLGDLVLSLSMVRTLKKALPDVRIAMVVRHSLAGIPARHPDVDNVVSIRNEWHVVARFFRLVAELTDLSCDAVIVCPGSLSCAIAAAAARIPKRIGSDQTLGLDMFSGAIKYPRLQYQTNGAFLIGMLDRLMHRCGRQSIASVFFTDTVPFNPAEHAAVRLCSLLHPLGIHNEPLHPEIIPSNESDILIEARGKELGIRWEPRPIIFVPGSIWVTKRWGEERYAMLAVGLSQRYPGRDILLCGDSDDRVLCNRISDTAGLSNLKNLSGMIPLEDLAALFRRCSVVIGNDSGAGHYAAAVGAPVVTLFGPTVPQFGFFPLGSRSVVIEGRVLECRPCGPYGGAYCPVKTHECMTAIQVEKVMEEIAKLEL